MKTKKKYLEEARQNVLNLAYDLKCTMQVLEAFRSAGWKFFERAPYTEPAAQQYQEGLNMMRNALYQKYTENIARCFALIGVEDESMRKYAKEKFKERFGNDTLEVMSFLEPHCHTPGCWGAEDEEAFRKECAEEIQKMEKE